MNLYKYTASPYVDMYSDLPLEWLQGQVKEKQTAINTQRDQLNKSAENWLKLNYGTFGKDLYDEINKEYQGKLQAMSESLLTKQDLPGVASSFSDFIREASFDPRIKDLNKEYAAYQEYLKNKLDPANYGAIDITEKGKQMGPEWNVDQAIGYYPLIKYEDSIQPYVATAEKFKPYKDTTTNKWIFTNPISGESFAYNTKEEAEQVSRPRLQEYFEQQYYNWNQDARSRHDKLTATNTDLNLFDPNFRFKDEGLGREVWRQKYLPYLNMAYTQKSREEDVKPIGGGKTGGDGKPGPTPPPLQESEYNVTNQNYGFNVLGQRLSTGEDINSYDSFIGNIQDHRDEIGRLNKQMVEASKQGDNAKVLLLDKERQNLMGALNTWESWQKVFEGDLYGKDLSKDLELALQLEQKYIDEHTGSVGGLDLGALSMIYKKPVQQIKDDIFKNKNRTYEGVDYDKVEELIKKASEVRIANLKGDAKEVYDRYTKYLNYQTSGLSYQPTTDKSKAKLDGLITSLIASNKIPNVLLTDKEVSDFPALAEHLQKLKAENGSYNTKGLSTEILFDDEDGPILTLHGLNPTGEYGTKIPNSIEYKLEDTPAIRQILAEVDPPNAIRNSYFVTAAQSLKDNKNKKGSFTMSKYGGNTEEVSFDRVPIGNGQYAFKDNNGVMHASLIQLIENKVLASADEDLSYKLVDDRFSTQINNLMMAGNYEAAKQKVAEYEAYKKKRDAEMGKTKQWTVRPKAPLR